MMALDGMRRDAQYQMSRQEEPAHEACSRSLPTKLAHEACPCLPLLPYGGACGRIPHEYLGTLLYPARSDYISAV
jgi:hypothetical protein